MQMISSYFHLGTITSSLNSSVSGIWAISNPVQPIENYEIYLNVSSRLMM